MGRDRWLPYSTDFIFLFVSCVHDKYERTQQGNLLGERAPERLSLAKCVGAIYVRISNPCQSLFPIRRSTTWCQIFILLPLLDSLWLRIYHLWEISCHKMYFQILQIIEWILVGVFYIFKVWGSVLDVQGPFLAVSGLNVQGIFFYFWGWSMFGGLGFRHLGLNAERPKPQNVWKPQRFLGKGSEKKYNIMVYFFHYLTIQRGGGTIKEVPLSKLFK